MGISNAEVFRAFLRNYKVGDDGVCCLYREYQQGRRITDIAGDRYIKPVMLVEEYFLERYGVDWKDGRRRAKTVREHKYPKAEKRRGYYRLPEITPALIQSYLDRGFNEKAVAMSLGVSRSAIRRRIEDARGAAA